MGERGESLSLFSLPFGGVGGGLFPLRGLGGY